MERLRFPLAQGLPLTAGKSFGLIAKKCCGAAAGTRRGLAVSGPAMAWQLPKP
jgi:hypothetical protein